MTWWGRDNGVPGEKHAMRRCERRTGGEAEQHQRDRLQRSRWQRIVVPADVYGRHGERPVERLRSVTGVPRFLRLALANRADHLARGKDRRRARHEEYQQQPAQSPRHPHQYTSAHSCARLSRSALPMTDTELKLIAAAAIIGDSSRSKKGYSTPAAMGTPAAL